MPPNLQHPFACKEGCTTGWLMRDAVPWLQDSKPAVATIVQGGAAGTSQSLAQRLGEPHKPRRQVQAAQMNRLR